MAGPMIYAPSDLVFRNLRGKRYRIIGATWDGGYAFITYKRLDDGLEFCDIDRLVLHGLEDGTLIWEDQP